MSGQDTNIKRLLPEAKTIAVVGLSDKPNRDSYRVARYMQQQGYKIVPVNPRLQAVLGAQAYPDLISVPTRIDIVNIFRRSELVLPVVQEAIKIRPMAIWMQLGISNEEAARLAAQNDIMVIMDKCIMVEHKRFGGTNNGR